VTRNNPYLNTSGIRASRRQSPGEVGAGLGLGLGLLISVGDAVLEDIVADMETVADSAGEVDGVLNVELPVAVGDTDGVLVPVPVNDRDGEEELVAVSVWATCTPYNSWLP
jgi:hypothetical protein